MSTVHLRPGHAVQTKLTRGMWWRIVRVITPASGERVFELVPRDGTGPEAKRGRIYVGTSEIDQEAIAA